ncbi:MAG: SCO family protein [Planctomycetota bacterium]
MPKGLVALFVVGVLAFGASVVALVLLRPTGPGGTAVGRPSSEDPTLPDPGLDQLSVPEFMLMNQEGEAVDQSLFEGRYTVLSLFFTHCVLVCPELSGAMAQVHGATEGTPIGFVSISVDPERDTPEVIKAYGERYGANFSRWSFVTGDRAEITKISRDGLLFELQDDTNEDNLITLPNGETMANIVHPSRLILVGPDRGVIGLYDYRFPEQLEMLKTRLRAILAQEG